LIDAILKVPQFSYSIKVLTNIITAEANIYKVELENIFNCRFITIIEHKCKPCVIINNFDFARNS
jgi:hypothetical protein